MSQSWNARLFALALLALAGLAHADIVVNTATDEDISNSSCSLREAITAVNTHGNYNGCVDAGMTWTKITFAIPGSGVQTIALGSDLPAITAPVFIDATTQPGTVCTPMPNLRVQLVGNASTTTGLSLSSGLASSSSGSTIRGLAISGVPFTPGQASSGLMVDSDNATVGCMIIGMDASGANAQPNAVGVYVAAKHTTIGEATATSWFPNIVSANSEGNVLIDPSTDDTLIAGNYIGVDQTGLIPQVGGFGVQTYGTHTRIGVGFSDGPAVHQRNVIGVHSTVSNASIDVDVENASDTIISGNYIGVGADGRTMLPIGSGFGVSVNTSMNTLIGCNGVGSWDDCRNVIAIDVNEPIIAGNGSVGLEIVSNFINVTADGITSLASAPSHGVSLAASALFARNVISAGGGTNISLFPPNDHSLTSVFLNSWPAGTNGATLDSSGNCLDDATSTGLEIYVYGTAIGSPTAFIRNWWGAADGPRPAGSGASADPLALTTPFLAAPSPYCGFDHIFTNGFDG